MSTEQTKRFAVVVALVNSFDYHKHHGDVQLFRAANLIHSLRRAGSELPVVCLESGYNASSIAALRHIGCEDVVSFPLEEVQSGFHPVYSAAEEPVQPGDEAEDRRIYMFPCEESGLVPQHRRDGWATSLKFVRTSDLRCSISSIFSYSVQDLTAAPGCI